MTEVHRPESAPDIGALIRLHQMGQRQIFLWVGVVVAVICLLVALFLYNSHHPEGAAGAFGIGLVWSLVQLAYEAAQMRHELRREPSIPVYRRDEWVKRNEG